MNTPLRFANAILLSGLLPLLMQGQGPVAAYLFNGNADDASGNGNHGTLSAYALFGTPYNLPVLVAGHDGTPNSAYHFPNSSGSLNGLGRIGLGTASVLDLGQSSFSVSVWMRYNNASFATRWAISNIAGPNATGFVVGLVNIGGQIHPKIYVGPPDGISYNAIDAYLNINLAPDTWYNVVWVVDRASNLVRGYLCGTVQPILEVANNCGTIAPNATEMSISACTSTAATSGPVQIGMAADIMATHFVNGMIDDLFVYNRVLTGQEAQDLCAGQIPGGMNGIAEQSAMNSLSVWPNPTAGALRILNPFGAGAALIVRNSAGQILQQQRVAPGEQAIGLNGFASGLYHLELIGDRGCMTGTVMVE